MKKKILIEQVSKWKKFIVKVNSKKEKFEKKKTSLTNLKKKDFGKYQK